jgi:uncharacterized repeat protein (TIGR01451 family)
VLFAVVAAIAFVPLAYAQSADLLTEKSGPATATAGSSVAYTVTVTNLGPDAAADVALNDPIPAGMTFVSATQDSGPPFACATPPVGSGGTITCTLASMSAGAAAQFTFTLQIDPGTPDGTSFVNVATATTSTADNNEENNSGTAGTSTPPPPQADLYIQKVGPNSAGADTDVSYTITIGNVGPDAASDAAWSDTLPGTMTFVSVTQTSGPTFNCTTPAVGAGGTIDCSLASMSAGATAVLTLVGHIPAGTAVGTEYVNVVTTSTKTDDTNPNNNTSQHLVTVTAVDAAVDKSGPAGATAGDDLTYTVVLSNPGSSNATVTLSDPVPPGTTFVSVTHTAGTTAICSGPPAGDTGTVFCTATLAPSGSSTIEIVVEAGDTTSVTNTASVTTDEYDTNASNNSDSATTTITPSADVSVVKNGPAGAGAGTNVTYTVIVANNGPSTAANVTLSDTLPAGTTFVSATQNSGPAFSCVTPAAGATGTITCTRASFAAASSATFTFVFAVSPALTVGTNIVNTSTVATTTGDPNSANDSSSTTAIVSTDSDVRLDKSGPAGVRPGHEITYTLTVTNDGPADAATVQISDPLPANTTFVAINQTSGPVFACVTPAVGANGIVTCSIATLPAFATASFQLRVLVSATATGSITNTATVSAGSADPSSANNSGAATTTLATANVPALSTWGLIFLAAALAAVAILRK